MAAVLALCCGSFAAAQEKPAPDVLRIAVSDSDRTIFDGLIAYLTARNAIGVPQEVKYTSPLASLHDFCQGAGGAGPDIVLTTVRMSSAVAGECARNKIDDIAELELGRSAVVLAVRSGSMLSGLTSEQVYLAIARDVPDKEEFRRNVAIRWSDIDRSLPQQDIRFQLPPREDGRRLMFDALLLEGGCRHETLVKLIFDAQQRTARCVTARVDRVREISRDQAVRALLDAPQGTVGVLSYPDIVQSAGQLVGLSMDGVSPGRDAVLDGTYDFSGSYWLYARRGQTGGGVAAAIGQVIARTASEAAIGPGGVLPGLGLAPLPADLRAAQRDALAVGSGSFGIASMLRWATSTASNAWSLTGIGFGGSNAADTGSALDFTTLMDIAGYTVKEVSSTVGIIPGAGMTFGMAREMSDADREYLRRALYRDAHRRPGVLPVLQRKVVRAVLDANAAGGYDVSQVEISFLPLPAVKLVVSPTDSAMSKETISIMRAIEQLNDRLSEGLR